MLLVLDLHAEKAASFKSISLASERIFQNFPKIAKGAMEFGGHPMTNLGRFWKIFESFW